MITIVMLLLIIFVSVVAWGLEKYKQDKFIAEAIDKNAPSPNYITPECQALIDQLKEPEKIKISRGGMYFQLPDGQKLSYAYDSMPSFQNRCDLSFEPTAKEWKILQGIVKKFYSEL